MNQALLVFTFSPVQSFIAEARRAGDLYAGSRILVQLAQAAAKTIKAQGGDLIYPADPEVGDVPNKLVATVPSVQEGKAFAEEAKKALLVKWGDIAENARKEIAKRGAPQDSVWGAIWDRQVGHVWEVYWVAAGSDSYKDAYRKANRALDSVKRTRGFELAEEDGEKDSLSGRRSALRVKGQRAKDYWAGVAALEKVTSAELRPEGKERLDALGVIKRFGKAADVTFRSTSTIAASDFVVAAAGKAADSLATYSQAVNAMLGNRARRVSGPDPVAWPHDGDLLYEETLTEERLRDSYGLKRPDREKLREAHRQLKALYQAAKASPSPYYAVIVLDGDSMGEQINRQLEAGDPEAAHKAFSRSLLDFAREVPALVDAQFGTLIYNGGDDVLAMAPLAKSLPLAQELWKRFIGTVKGCTASAGIAVVHHLYPLDAALRAAREAEKQAKRVPLKDAVCVRVLKRSGEVTEMRSKWGDLASTFDELVGLFKGHALSSKFPYDVLASAFALPDADDKLQAELKRLLRRHRNDKHTDAPDPEKWAERLKAWAANLPGVPIYRYGGCIQQDKEADDAQPNKAEELGRWLAFARFVAQGGGE